MAAKQDTMMAVGIDISPQVNTAWSIVRYAAAVVNFTHTYQLTEVRTNGVLAETYQYDALGRRVSIIAGNVTNNFVYSGPHIVAEYSNNVLARSYAYGPVIDDVLSLTTYGAATNTYYAA